MDTLPRASAASARRRRRAAGGAAVVAALLAGCGLRLETPDPEPLIPDQLEIVRAAAAADAADLVATAAEAGATATPEVAVVLARIAEASAAHLDGLGGTYVPFPDATPTATATPTVAPAPPAEAGTVLDALLRAATSSRADAESVADPAMARLLASVTVNRSLLADELAGALGTTAGPVIAFVVPQTMPEGTAAQEAGVLVQSEDAAALAWEVVAARSTGPDRDLAAARAAVHRDRAQAWAEAAGIAGEGADPRRVSYALPEALDDPGTSAETLRAAMGEVEAALAESYLSLVAAAHPGARGPLVDATLDCLRVQAAAGVPPSAFPGLPEQA